MILQFVLITALLGHSASSPQPTFSVKDDNILTVVFPSSPVVDHAVFTYTYSNTGVRHTATIQRNSAGYLVCDLRRDARIAYSVQYFSKAGTLLYRQEGTYRPTTAVVPKHQVVRRGTTVLYDTFDSNHLDMNKWRHEITCWGGGNGEFQMYTPEGANTYIKNGELYLKPTYTADKFGENFLHHGTLDVRKTWGDCTSDNEGGCYRKANQIPPIMSSKLYSKASITHGRVEVVAKLPRGDWLWPAIWMLPPGWPWKYGGWPTSGEIDIMEARGNTDLKDPQGNDQGLNVVYSTIHWGVDPGQHRQAGHWLKTNGGTWADGYHTYALDWTSDHIKMEVDKRPVFTWNTPNQGIYQYSHFGGNNPWSGGAKDAPFDGKFSLILNVAVGGGFFNDGWINKGYAKPWRSNSGNAMMDFWNNRHNWQSTWHGDDTAMKIRSVKMIQY